LNNELNQAIQFDNNTDQI